MRELADTVLFVTGTVVPLLGEKLREKLARPTPMLTEVQRQSLNFGKARPVYIKEQNFINLRGLISRSKLNSAQWFYLFTFAQLCDVNIAYRRPLPDVLFKKLAFAHQMCDRAGENLVDVLNRYAAKNRIMKIRR